MAGKHFKEHVNEQVFREHPIVNYLETAPQEYDITGKQVGTFDFMDKGTFSNMDYSRAVLLRLCELPLRKIPDFIKYQLTLMEDSNTWLEDLEILIEKNKVLVDAYKSGVTDACKSVIDALLNTSLRNQLMPTLVWRGSTTDMMELIVALTQSGKILNQKGQPVQRDVERAFAQLFNIKLDNADMLLSQTKARKRNRHPFLDELVAAFEAWDISRGYKPLKYRQ